MRAAILSLALVQATALRVTVLGGNGYVGQRVCEKLVERGCDVNATDYQGRAALHHAARNNRRETARVLLERGADRTIKDTKGNTAAGFARQKGHEDIAAYITGFSLKPRPPLQHGLSAIPSDDAPRASSIAGLVELLRELKLEEHLPRATKWCVDNGAESVAIIIELGEGTSFVAAVFPDLKPLKRKQLLAKLGASDAPSSASPVHQRTTTARPSTAQSTTVCCAGRSTRSLYRWSTRASRARSKT